MGRDWTDFFDTIKAERNQPPPAPSSNGHRPDVDHPLVKAALDRRLTELAAMAPKSGRNDALNAAAAYLGRFPIDRGDLRDMLLDACHANGVLQEDGPQACDGTISSGFKKADKDGPRTIEDRPHTNGYTFTETTADNINNDGPAPNLPIIDTRDIDGGFWDARPSLTAIHNAALSRMCAPWAVLAHCAARALTQVRPHVTLPPIIGGRGSLNWFAAIAAPSGGGKGSASAVSRELVTEPVRERGMGSGEGMIGAFYKPGTQNTPPEVHESVMFAADEIDGVTALGNRTGSTMMSILRSGFAGETLGFSYIAKGRDVHIDAHTYRMTLVVSIQPARSGALLGDHGGGTPQRFQWFPGVDQRITDPPPDHWVTALTLPSPGEWRYPRELQIPDAARRLVIAERARNGRGELGALDGHAVFCREKFAYSLTVLDGRTEMTEEDWELSGVAALVSERTRLWVAEKLADADETEAVERGRLAGVGHSAAEEEKTYRAGERTQRITRWVLGKLAEKGPMSNRELTQAASSRDRVWLAGALLALQNAGVVGKDDKKRWVKR